ncbi:hypothetical protein AB0K90_22350 [Streptomyces syringium]
METTGKSAGTRTGVHHHRHDGGRDGLLRIHLQGQLDDGRERSITTAISPTYAKQILELQEAGATEEDLHPIVAEAITESYFTDWSTRAAGLRADFTHVSKIEFRF